MINTSEAIQTTKNILSAHNLSSDRMEMLEQLTASSNKVLFGIKTADKKYWLKVFPEERKFRQELEAFTLLQQNNIRNIPNLIGFTHKPIATLLLSNLDGEDCSKTTELPSIVFYHAGSFLKSLHALEIKDTDNLSPLDALTLRIKALSKQGRKLKITEVYPEFQQQLNSITPLLSKNQHLLTRAFSHRDFTPRNWLYDTTEKNLNVFDFEHSRIDITLLDITKLNAHYFPDSSKYRKEFFKGYFQDNDTAEEDKFTQTLNTLTLFYGLQTLAWATRYNDQEYLNLANEALKTHQFNS